MKLVPYTAEFFGGLGSAELQTWLHERTQAGHVDPLKTVGQIGVLGAPSPPEATELLEATAVQLQISEIPVSQRLREALGAATIEVLEKNGPLRVEASWRAMAEWFRFRQTPLPVARARGLLSTVVRTKVVAEASGQSTRSIDCARIKMSYMLAQDHHKQTRQIPEALANLKRLRETLARPTSKRLEHLKWALNILLPEESFLAQLAPAQGEEIIRAYGRRHVGWLRTWILGEGHDPVISVLCLEQACRGYHMPDVGRVLGRDPVRLKSRMKDLIAFLRASSTPEDAERIRQFVQSTRAGVKEELELGQPHFFALEELAAAKEEVRVAGNLFGYRSSTWPAPIRRPKAPPSPPEIEPPQELPEAGAAQSVTNLVVSAGLRAEEARALTRYTLHDLAANPGNVNDTVCDALYVLQEAVGHLLPKLTPPHRAVMSRFFGAEGEDLGQSQGQPTLTNFPYEQLRQAVDQLAVLLRDGEQ